MTSIPAIMIASAARLVRSTCGHGGPLTNCGDAHAHPRTMVYSRKPPVYGRPGAGASRQPPKPALFPSPRDSAELRTPLHQRTDQNSSNSPPFGQPTSPPPGQLTTTEKAPANPQLRQHRRRKVCAAPWRSISNPLPPSLATPRHAAYSAFGAAPARGCGCGGCMLRTRACGPNSRHCKLQTPQSRIAPAPQTCSSNFSARVMIRLHLFSGIGHWLETKINGAARKLRGSVQHSKSRRNGGYARPSTLQAAAAAGAAVAAAA
jgi:hypothetical protein